MTAYDICIYVYITCERLYDMNTSTKELWDGYETSTMEASAPLKSLLDPFRVVLIQLGVPPFQETFICGTAMMI